MGRENPIWLMYDAQDYKGLYLIAARIDRMEVRHGHATHWDKNAGRYLNQRNTALSDYALEKYRAVMVI